MMYDAVVTLDEEEIKALMAQHRGLTRAEVCRAIIEAGPDRSSVQSALAAIHKSGRLGRPRPAATPTVETVVW